MLRSLVRIVVLAAASPLLLSAQRPAPPNAPARICDMSYKMLMLTVVDAQGTPVPGVTVSLSGIAATSEGRPARTTSAIGEVQLAEDGDKQFVKPTGSRVTVTLRKGSRVRRVRMTLGHDAGGCHIALLSGKTTVTF